MVLLPHGLYIVSQLAFPFDPSHVLRHGTGNGFQYRDNVRLRPVHYNSASHRRYTQCIRNELGEDQQIVDEMEYETKIMSQQHKRNPSKPTWRVIPFQTRRIATIHWISTLKLRRERRIQFQTAMIF
eukprot:1009706_1